YLIDLVALEGADLAPLREALAAAEAVAHNAVFDLQFLARLGISPRRTHCTMLLSRLVHGTRRGDGFHGLGQTVQRELGRSIDKTEQRSDWSASTLTPQQLRYAALDAAVLLPLYRRLRERV